MNCLITNSVIDELKFKTKTFSVPGFLSFEGIKVTLLNFQTGQAVLPELLLQINLTDSPLPMIELCDKDVETET